MVIEQPVLVEPLVNSPDRIDRLKKQFNQAIPSVCVERALEFTRSHRETEGLPLIVRRAKAFRTVCENIPVIILASPKTDKRHVKNILKKNLTWSF